MISIKIIGLNVLSYDACSALITDNTIKTAIEEERLSKIKHHSGFLLGGSAPELSMKRCMKNRNLDYENIAFGWDINYLKYLKDSCGNIYNAIASSVNKKLFSESRSFIFKSLLGYRRYLNFIKKIKKQGKNTYFIPHHLAHCAHAYRTSGFKKSNILVLDSYGEKSSISLFIGEKNEIGLFKEFPFTHSLGNLYKLVTRLIGMGYHGEGKTMGLASYGKVDKRYNLIGLSEDNLKINRQKLLKLALLLNKRVSFKLKSNIAATLQNRLEETAILLAEQLYNHTGYKKLCIAGGVALNCKMNSALLNSDFLNDICIPSAPNDAGVALGSALQMAFQQGYRFKKLDHAYLGPEYSDKEIKTELIKSNLEFEYFTDISGIAAEMISKGEVIAWFQGRMEFGPRALGNRSILADPTNPKIKDKVNDTKHRERWRPLSPSVLADKMSKYFDTPYKSPFMSLTFQVKEEKRTEIPSVTHIDGSARVQTVNKKNNLKFYKLIKEFEKINGIPLVLNTSFNDCGQPIVMTPKDAIETFNRMNLDRLIIGNYLINKNG
ncbi:MAG: carbamoyltransferase C-terminal domain-containing protein [Nanoarchaeota archaeon]